MTATVAEKRVNKYRPRRTTIFLLISAAMILLLCNLAEEDSPDFYGDGRYGPSFSIGTFAWQGWPYACLRRGATFDDPAGKWHYSTWRIWTEVDEFCPLMAIANLGIGCILLAVTGISIETWLRVRRPPHWWSLSIVDILAGFFVVSIALAIAGWHWREYRRELAIVKKLEAEQYPPLIRWESANLSWKRHLRSILGRRSFDRAIEVSIVDSEQLRHISQLSKVKVIDLSLTWPSKSHLAELEKLESLEALVIIDPQGAGPNIQLPYLPNLRGLNLWGAAFDGPGLENVPKLEHFEATNTWLDDGDIEKLSQLHRLRKLRMLRGCRFSESGLAKLRAALPNCEIETELKPLFE
jgi:hypothetical protein